MNILPSCSWWWRHNSKQTTSKTRKHC